MNYLHGRGPETVLVFSFNETMADDDSKEQEELIVAARRFPRRRVRKRRPASDNLDRVHVWGLNSSPEIFVQNRSQRRPSCSERVREGRPVSFSRRHRRHSVCSICSVRCVSQERRGGARAIYLGVRSVGYQHSVEIRHSCADDSDAGTKLTQIAIWSG